ncbi:T9SS type B sorting domain-containing protein [Polaribacter sp.]|uniref:T9SS type B sorting domain-containing protein n=1 Tax=Polaribacter sp. TaxID=1920175 RepID=UPI0025D23EBF|nr:T9SS type B sorting domain-containing protein [Polaribacter sp.]
MKKLLLFLVFLMCATSAFSQLSKKHFIPPLTSTSSDEIVQQYIYISTPNVNNVSYKITPVGNPEISAYSGIVTNTSPVRQSILNTAGTFEDFNSNSQLHVPNFNVGGIITNKGFIIEASDVIYVSIRVISNSLNHAGALVSKGSSALGNSFRVGGFVREGGTVDNHLTFASLMATEDNTTVNITNLPAGFTQPNSSSVPNDIILNEGESYVIALSTTGGTDPKDLIGSLISSDKPIVVNSGSATGSFGNSNGRDYGIDQIVGADKIGTEYILVRGSGIVSNENALIIAHEDDTEISINGNSSTTTIDAGEYFVVEGNNYVNGNMFISTSKPTFVYQGIAEKNNQFPDANQGLFFVPPLSCENKGDVNNIASIDRIGDSNFTGGVTIVTNTGATITINDMDISTFAPQGPINVTGNSNYVTYKVSGLSGNIKVESNQELYCAYFNKNGAATTGAFYSGFPSAPEINFNTTVATLGSCIPNVTLQAANTDLFDSFEWQFFNETTSTWEQRSTTADYEPLESEPGKYRLIGTINCTGATFNSVEIPVSICPDDFDNDLIIDNVDIDLDNDGILNIDESLGDGIVNFTNLTNPTIDASGNLITNFLTGNKTSDGDVNFIGNTNGIFISTINDNSSANASNIYELESTETFNFEFTQDANQPHTAIEGVEYEIGIGPAAKNVTLIDPDNILLVDTNFDGQFQADVDNYSSSLIRFRYNPSPNGNTPFKFVANGVDKILFYHIATSNVTNSVFNGNLKLTNIRIDSDGDGIEDALDLDSDNDGVPDLFEVANQNITLLNTDNNLDGLDDVFDTFTSGNLDTDGDRVPNHLDLDSDNDGIYDLVESGFTVTDANNDGIIDNANSANVGANGLLDTLESTADSGVLATPLRNSDATSIVTANQDAIFDFADLESDGDDCFDVIEAGFEDPNNDGVLGDLPNDVDFNGLVENYAVGFGYTAPNADYIISAPIVVNSFVDAVFCELDTDFITIDSTADSFQWQVSTDGSTWQTIDNTDLTDAYENSNSKDLRIINTPLSYHNYQYRVILNRTGNACTEISYAVTLTVNPLPILKANPELYHCIEAGNPNPTVNLTLADNSVSDTPNVTFEYYRDIAGTDLITDPTSYPVIVNTTQSVYAKVISNPFGCSGVLSEVKINVGEIGIEYKTLGVLEIECDDFTGEDKSDFDKQTLFKLNEDFVRNQIDNTLDKEKSTIYYYQNNRDRTQDLKEERVDITNFRNDSTKINITNIPEGIKFPIYYKILSNVNNDCQGLGEFYLQINNVPETSNQTLPPIMECDTGTFDADVSNGSNANINLKQRIDDAMSGTGQDKNDFIFRFYKSEAAAFSGDITSDDYISNPEQFTNDVPTGFTQGDIVTQPIFLRIENKYGCVNPHTSFNVIINPIPTILIDIIPPLEVCDMGTDDGDLKNGLEQEIDLSIKDEEILTGRIKNDFTVTYHKSIADLEDLSSNGVNKTGFDSDRNRITINPVTGSSEEILYIRVKNDDTGCIFDDSTLTVIVHPEPNIPDNITNYSDCDNTTDDDGEDDNGINGDITLNNKIPEILANYPPGEFSNFDITFYKKLVDAQSGDPSLALNGTKYQNKTFPFNQEIFVRVENKNTKCVYDDLSFFIKIKPKPSFTVLGEKDLDDPQIICLNDTPLKLRAENFAAKYNYKWKDETGAEIGYDSEQLVYKDGKYTVTAYDDFIGGCSRERTIVVKESDRAILESSFVTIVDESNSLGSTNNLSISIDVINNDLGPGDYQFAIINTDDNTRIPFIGFQDEPLFENLEGGIYTVIVNDRNGCVEDTTLPVSVIQFPKFFTPNGDNNNDTWVVKGANRTFYTNASINIFNRFGNLVAQVPIDENGWDGTYNGKLLPSDDYWYNVTLVPADTTKPTINKKGNLSLLRK